MTLAIKPIFKNHLSLIVSILMLLGMSHDLFAQYTEIVNSNRPGFSRSPFTVGKHVVQFQTGVNYGSYTWAENGPESNFLTNEWTLRVGLTERFELNFEYEIKADRMRIESVVDDATIRFTEDIVGNSVSILGATYHLYSGRRWIPALALYAGMNTNLVDEYYQNQNLSPIVGLLTQNDFGRVNLVTNFYADWRGPSQQPQLIHEAIADDQEDIVSIQALPVSGNQDLQLRYFISMTHAIAPRWAYFIEYWGNYDTGSTQDALAHNLNAGGAFLLTEDMQLDLIGGMGFNFKQPNYFIELGFTYRFDNNNGQYQQAREREYIDRNSDLPEQYKSLDPKAIRP